MEVEMAEDVLGWVGIVGCGAYDALHFVIAGVEGFDHGLIVLDADASGLADDAAVFCVGLDGWFLFE